VGTKYTSDKGQCPT